MLCSCYMLHIYIQCNAESRLMAFAHVRTRTRTTQRIATSINKHPFHRKSSAHMVFWHDWCENVDDVMVYIRFSALYSFLLLLLGKYRTVLLSYMSLKRRSIVSVVSLYLSLECIYWIVMIHNTQ